jgi:catechol 2,3-dioxygenase-like lactoylglutathione lyase family enzyme
MASAMRLELIQVPVSDIDRAKAFYVDKLGFAAEASRQELAARGVEVSDVQVFP